jgi:hypothetical protein
MDIDNLREYLRGLEARMAFMETKVVARQAEVVQEAEPALPPYLPPPRPHATHEVRNEKPDPVNSTWAALAMNEPRAASRVRLELNHGINYTMIAVGALVAGSLVMGGMLFML